MEKDLNKEKMVGIVTGGASGLGHAIAEEFVAKGITTIVIGRNEEKLKAAKSNLGELCTYYAFDLNNLEKVPALINQIVNEHGRIDILVNNAGINHKKPFIEVTNEEFEKVIATNLTAVFAISREVAKHMLTNKSGSIINISSMAAQYGIPQVMAYTASKTGIEGMTRAMAVELSPHGIRVNCVAPGFIATDMSAKALNNDPERKQKVLSRTPMGKLGTPADVAGAVYYFANNTSTFVTGTILPVDGGNSIGF